jgi:hypothetical protein
MGWARHVACMEAVTNAYKILVKKPERRRPLAVSGCRWEDNSKSDLKEIGYEMRARVIGLG